METPDRIQQRESPLEWSGKRTKPKGNGDLGFNAPIATIACQESERSRKAMETRRELLQVHCQRRGQESERSRKAMETQSLGVLTPPAANAVRKANEAERQWRPSPFLDFLVFSFVRKANEAERQWRLNWPLPVLVFSLIVRKANEAERQWRLGLRGNALGFSMLSGKRTKPKGNGDRVGPTD